MDHETMRRLHRRGLKRVAHDIVLRDRREIATDTWLFVFDKPDGFVYRAGQHVRMKLKGEYRFWSFASAPFEDSVAFAVRMRGSHFKLAMKALPAGARVRIEMLAAPLTGAFWLERDERRPAVFLCGGIGVVPAVSMIKQALHDGYERRLILIHACRRPSDAPFFVELRALAAAHGAFTYVPVMTRSQAEDGWDGEAGRIDAAMARRHISDIRETEVYVAGRHGMVRDMRTMLDDMDVPGEAIRMEDFGEFATARKRVPWGLAAIAVVVLLAHGGLVFLGLKVAPPVEAIAAALVVMAAIKLGWVLWGRRR